MKEKKETFDSILDERKSTSIYHKLHKAKQEMGKVTKGANNPFFKSKYADLNSILEVVEPALLKYDLLLIQPIIDGNVHSRIVDIESGEFVDSYLQLPSIADPQKIISSVTYFRRACLQSLLSLQAVDDDGNEASKAKKTISMTDFQRGIEKLSPAKFKEFCLGYELTEVQSKALIAL